MAISSAGQQKSLSDLATEMGIAANQPVSLGDIQTRFFLSNSGGITVDASAAIGLDSFSDKEYIVQDAYIATVGVKDSGNTTTLLASTHAGEVELSHPKLGQGIWPADPKVANESEYYYFRITFTDPICNRTGEDIYFVVELEDTTDFDCRFRDSAFDQGLGTLPPTGAPATQPAIDFKTNGTYVQSTKAMCKLVSGSNQKVQVVEFSTKAGSSATKFGPFYWATEPTNSNGIGQTPLDVINQTENDFIEVQYVVVGGGGNAGQLQGGGGGGGGVSFNETYSLMIPNNLKMTSRVAPQFTGGYIRDATGTDMNLASGLGAVEEANSRFGAGTFDLKFLTVGYSGGTCYLELEDHTFSRSVYKIYGSGGGGGGSWVSPGPYYSSVPDSTFTDTPKQLTTRQDGLSTSTYGTAPEDGNWLAGGSGAGSYWSPGYFVYGVAGGDGGVGKWRYAGGGGGGGTRSVSGSAGGNGSGDGSTTLSNHIAGVGGNPVFVGGRDNNYHGQGGAGAGGTTGTALNGAGGALTEQSKPAPAGSHGYGYDAAGTKDDSRGGGAAPGQQLTEPHRQGGFGIVKLYWNLSTSFELKILSTSNQGLNTITNAGGKYLHYDKGDNEIFYIDTALHNTDGSWKASVIN